FFHHLPKQLFATFTIVPYFFTFEATVFDIEIRNVKFHSIFIYSLNLHNCSPPLLLLSFPILFTIHIYAISTIVYELNESYNFYIFDFSLLLYDIMLHFESLYA